jgi:hypothetical protein
MEDYDEIVNVNAQDVAQMIYLLSCKDPTSSDNNLSPELKQKMIEAYNNELKNLKHMAFLFNPNTSLNSPENPCYTERVQQVSAQHKSTNEVVRCNKYNPIALERTAVANAFFVDYDSVKHYDFIALCKLTQWHPYTFNENGEKNDKDKIPAKRGYGDSDPELKDRLRGSFYFYKKAEFTGQVTMTMLEKNKNTRFIITGPNQLDNDITYFGEKKTRILNDELNNLIYELVPDVNYKVHFALTYMQLPMSMQSSEMIDIGISIVPLHFSGGVEMYGNGIADQIKKLQASKKKPEIEDKMFANYILGYYRYYIGYEKILSESFIWKIYKDVLRDDDNKSKRHQLGGIIRYIDLISQ